MLKALLFCPVPFELLQARQLSFFLLGQLDGILTKIPILLEPQKKANCICIPFLK
jgi:hypothetical protein